MPRPQSRVACWIDPTRAEASSSIPAARPSAPPRGPGRSFVEGELAGGSECRVESTVSLVLLPALMGRLGDSEELLFALHDVPVVSERANQNPPPGLVRLAKIERKSGGWAGEWAAGAFSGARSVSENSDRRVVLRRGWAGKRAEGAFSGARA